MGALGLECIRGQRCRLVLGVPLVIHTRVRAYVRECVGTGAFVRLRACLSVRRKRFARVRVRFMRARVRACVRVRVCACARGPTAFVSVARVPPLSEVISKEHPRAAAKRTHLGNEPKGLAFETHHQLSHPCAARHAQPLNRRSPRTRARSGCARAPARTRALGAHTRSMMACTCMHA